MGIVSTNDGDEPYEGITVEIRPLGHRLDLIDNSALFRLHRAKEGGLEKRPLDIVRGWACAWNEDVGHKRSTVLGPLPALTNVFLVQNEP